MKRFSVFGFWCFGRQLFGVLEGDFYCDLTLTGLFLFINHKGTRDTKRRLHIHPSHDFDGVIYALCPLCLRGL